MGWRSVQTAAALCALLCAGASAQQRVTEPAASRTSLASNSPYTISPGDTVTVTFRFTPEFNDEVIVQPDGHVNLKSTGDLRVAGLTLTQAMHEIESASANKLVNPDVVVSLKDFDRPHFVVAGEVQTPGRFEIRKPVTALQALMLAGGPKEDSALNHVYLFRRLNSDTSEVRVLQLGRYDARTRATNDVILQPDDMLLVRRDGLEKIGRFIKTFNLGLYLNPIPANAF